MEKTVVYVDASGLLDVILTEPRHARWSLDGPGEVAEVVSSARAKDERRFSLRIAAPREPAVLDFTLRTRDGEVAERLSLAVRPGRWAP